MENKQTVYVGLSGGVDSSVAALRLKKQGYNVVGVFIKVWHPDFMVCNWEQERLDAMRVAAHLDIPFLTCDAEEAYKNEVADYFISEYIAGRTPNPDVMCNKSVKFGAFMRFAKERRADFIATGHYVQKVNGELHRGVDKNKDQSYFLWSLTEEQLAYSLFPVGNSPKEQIRKEAMRAGIPTAEKKDSQGVCFLGHIDIPDFLSHYTELKEGEVLSEEGQVIGTHKGALVYTIGQRHGFELTNHDTARNQMFVVSKDTEKNTITVSSDQPKITERDELILENFILRGDFNNEGVLEAQFRYRQKPFEVNIKVDEDKKIRLHSTQTEERPASGQSCVLYQGELCIGGGIIK